MSSRSSVFVEKKEFVKRFVETCGTSEASEISRLLNISYQAARNYLDGRLPDSHVLLSIADKTPYSIHWLLTGLGEKYANADKSTIETPEVEIIREAAKQGCAMALREILSENTLAKTVTLENKRLRKEKSREDS